MYRTLSFTKDDDGGDIKIQKIYSKGREPVYDYDFYDDYLIGEREGDGHMRVMSLCGYAWRREREFNSCEIWSRCLRHRNWPG